MATEQFRNGCIGIGVVLALLVAPFSASASKLYKWTDEKGVVHYSDKLPPESVKKAHQKISDEGYVKEEVKREKTQEERIAEQVQESMEIEERRRQAEIEARQRRRDRILLDTFTTERDLVLTRDDRLNSIDSIINLTKSNNKRFAEQMQTVKTRIEKIEKSGREVPKNMRDQLASISEQHQSNENFIERKQREREKLLSRFNDDLARFRELKGISPPPAEENIDSATDEKTADEKESDDAKEQTAEQQGADATPPELPSPPTAAAANPA